MEEESGLARQIDSYCERMDFTFWGEPINAVSNAAFVIAALWMWMRIERLGAGDAAGIGKVLCAMLAGTGVGSFLWHTFATAWAVSIDVAFIALFTLTYIYAANRYFWELGVWLAGFGALLFLPYASVVGSAFAQLPFFEISFFYWPIPLLIFAYGIALWQRRPATGRGLVLGASLLVVSLFFRSIDEAICDHVHVGSHFLWHVLNGIMLGWMIEVLRRVGAGQGGNVARGSTA
ncbi:MAG: hypothetical protein AAF865_03500 [Pseudomonadota bacterium]